LSGGRDRPSDPPSVGPADLDHRWHGRLDCVDQLIDQDYANFGFDAQTGEFADLVRAGIIDPPKAVWVALQDAGSVAGLLITTEAMVAEKPEPKVAAAVPGGMDL